MPRILIVSDVHANPWALEAIEREAGPVDGIFCVGDSVSYGPDPVAVLTWLRRRNATVIQGNHDHAVAHDADPKAAPAKRLLALAMRDWTRAQLPQAEREYLGSLPRRRSVEVAGNRFLLIHGSPADELFDYRMAPGAPQALLDAVMAGLDTNVVVLGHTHLPMLRRAAALQVVNPGSSGQPLDGDPRACYALWEDGAFRLMRVAYDVRPLLDAIGRTGLPSEIREGLSEIIVNASLSPRGDGTSSQA